MHKTNQELVAILNANTGNSLNDNSYCIPLYRHQTLVSVTCLEPMDNNACSIHTWVNNPSSNWLTRDYLRTVYEYAFTHYATIVAHVPQNNLPAMQYAISSGYTACYSTEQYTCYTLTRAQYTQRFSSLYRSCAQSWD
jgi:hypothetical protein